MILAIQVAATFTQLSECPQGNNNIEFAEWPAAACYCKVPLPQPASASLLHIQKTQSLFAILLVLNLAFREKHDRSQDPQWLGLIREVTGTK